MFQKIKDIKKYIKLAKIGGTIFMFIFILMIVMNVFQQFQIADLKNSIEVLGNI